MEHDEAIALALLLATVLYILYYYRTWFFQYIPHYGANRPSKVFQDYGYGSRNRGYIGLHEDDDEDLDDDGDDDISDYGLDPYSAMGAHFPHRATNQYAWRGVRAIDPYTPWNGVFDGGFERNRSRSAHRSHLSQLEYPMHNRPAHYMPHYAVPGHPIYPRGFW